MNYIKAHTRNLICTTLQERSFIFSHRLSFIIDVCGYKFASNILGQTLKLELEGGMMTVDGSRRRTMGGAFMRLAHEQMTREQRREVARLLRRKLYPKADPAKPAEIVEQAASVEAVVEPEVIAESVNPPALEVTANKPEPKKKQSAKPAAPKKHDFAASRQARFQTTLEPLDDLPSAVMGKLQQLQGAANVLRERVQQLESKPAGEQVGLEMARKLLTNTENQIAALLAEHERSSEGVS